LGCKMDLGLARTQLLSAAVEIAASLSHQLMRWSTSQSGAGCAANVFEYLSDVDTVRDERNQAHLARTPPWRFASVSVSPWPPPLP
jgi:hypothetical protein